MKTRVAVLGAGGYTGGELLRLLLGHPRVELKQAVSATHAGKPLHHAHPNLRGASALSFRSDLEPRVIDLLFLAQGHGDSMAALPGLLALRKDLRVIDLSGDFRLEDKALYPAWYGREHSAPELLGSFVYGLSELNAKAVAKARHVANPGCIASAAALSLGPLAREGFQGTAHVSAVTGSSGSGVKPTALTHHPTRGENMRAYKPLRHQHSPEVEQLLARLGKTAPAGARLKMALTAVSGPFVRGIYSLTHLALPEDWNGERLKEAFRRSYKDCSFIRLLESPPELNAVRGSNYCDIHAAVEGPHAVIIAALDNLVKGAAGQAVQNMNLMLGFDETEGLKAPGIYP